MPQTLGAAFDASVAELRAAARALPAIPQPGQIRTLTLQTRDFLGALRAYPDTFARDTARVPGNRTVMGRALADIRLHLTAAEQHMTIACRQAVAISGPAGEPGHRLDRAATHLSVTRDVLNSHRGPDGQPLTPYLFLLATARAQRYVFSRVTDLARETGLLAAELAARSENPAVTTALSAARHALHQAAVLGRQANRDHMTELAELPLAPPLTPDRAPRPDLPGTLERVAEDTDRIIRGTFEAARSSGRPVSGSDLQQIARSLALGHLLTGRLLLHLAEEQPATISDQLRTNAAELREAAQHWQRTAQSFTRIVDLADPREHPALPHYGYDDV
ncbi:hypothetical protein ACSNOC_27575, partial [Streptomyces sp. URMC 129]